MAVMVVKYYLTTHTGDGLHPLIAELTSLCGDALLFIELKIVGMQNIKLEIHKRHDLFDW